MDNLDFCGAIPDSVVRNPTDRSRFCESLVVSFVESGASYARVRVEMIAEYGTDELYHGLRNATCKYPYKGDVTVSKRDGMLILRRAK